jgi:transglutaminase-like putative cysteine protease/tetratricopeptide (TPR) repeat protein
VGAAGIVGAFRQMRFKLALLSGASLLLAPWPALAGNDVLYGAAPAWVALAEIDQSQVKDGPAELLDDWQQRLEEGVVYEYQDRAVRIDNPQTLMEEGTISLIWMPDKGDLTVHALEIVRGRETIDLLKQGARFDVLRREQGLEMRLLDGQLTATVAVPGLKLGDVLRYRYSTSISDQALGKEVQALQYLESEPWKVGKARVIVSWPEKADIYWKVEEAAGLSEPKLRDGYRYLEVDLPLAEPKDVPYDAPSRYARDSILRVGSFADWQELSRTMAPVFEKAAQVAPDGEVAKQADAIMKRTSDPLERAVLAVRLVQDDVSYMLNGLDGGNYIPQDAEFTWDKRYGDCKAKTVLLTALLRRMGIDATPTLVVSRGGDALPYLLPVPADFDHVIVRTRIGDVDYWLDGTSAATRMANVANVPPFFHGLPLLAKGSDLVAMPQRVPANPDMAFTIEMDHSAGVDLPVLYEAKVEISGPQGAAMQKIVDQNDPTMLRRMARQMGSGGMTQGVVSSIELDYDEDAALATLRFKGVGTPDFEWRDGKLVMGVQADPAQSSFNPDRARRDWQNIPVATPATAAVLFNISMRLPQDGKGFTLSGARELQGAFGNTTFDRSVDLAGDRMVTQAKVVQLLGEIAPADIAAAKLAARKAASDDLRLAAPQDVTWRWQLDNKERKTRIAPIAAAYQAAIDFAEKDDSGPLVARAQFYVDVFDYAAALKDYDRIIESWPSSAVYSARARVLLALDRRDDAIVDLRAGYDLDGSTDAAIELSHVLAYGGQIEAASEILEGLPVSEDERIYYANARATIAGLGGDEAGGLAIVEEQLARTPQNATMLNFDCWYRGLFKVGLDEALGVCTRAVERAGDGSAAALDSRAMARYRLGQMDEALADLDAALELVPDIAASRYLRGTILLERGDARGKADLEAALRMSPDLAQMYRRHGIEPKI